MTNFAYAYRALAFIDILGWSGHVERSVKEPARADALKDILGKAREYAGMLPALTTLIERGQTADPDLVAFLKILSGSADFKASHFSDTIVISCDCEHPVKHTGPIMLAFLAQKLGQELLLQGFLTRGVLTAGLLHHDGESIFGPALVEAAKEEKRADLPRIMVYECFIDVIQSGFRLFLPDGKAQAQAERFLTSVIRSGDGARFLSIFAPGVRRGHRPEEELALLVAARRVVERMLASLEDEELEVAEKDKRRRRQRWLLEQISICEADGHTSLHGTGPTRRR